MGYNTVMDSLRNLMGQRDFDTPKEVIIIKDFVRKKFHNDIDVKLQPRSITIVVNSAGFAASLRTSLPELYRQLGTQKRIFIRIV